MDILVNEKFTNLICILFCEYFSSFVIFVLFCLFSVCLFSLFRLCLVFF